jgi:hypothetical protein
MNPAFQPGGDPARSAIGSRREQESTLIFMRRLVHDLNNALSVITIDAGLLRVEAAEADSVVELVDEVQEAAARASTLAGQLRRCVSEVLESLPSSR